MTLFCCCVIGGAILGVAVVIVTCEAFDARLVSF